MSTPGTFGTPGPLGTSGTPGTLGILYHMPCWQAADGSVWEAEGSFGRYVDSLAPYFDEIVLSVPVFATPPPSGSRLRSTNVRLAPLPYFPGPRQFYPMLPAMHRRLREFVHQCDVIHLRVPTPAAIFAFRLEQAARTERGCWRRPRAGRAALGNGCAELAGSRRASCVCARCAAVLW